MAAEVLTFGSNSESTLGLGNVILNLFKSYKWNMLQLVNVSGIFFSKTQMSCGLPQGSIPGPF